MISDGPGASLMFRIIQELFFKSIYFQVDDAWMPDG
jgi:hypothetical protein